MKSFFAATRFRLLFLLLATLGLLTTACSKDESPIDYGPVDDATITKYLADKAITTAQKQPSGLYFIPTTTNANAKLATVGSTASIRYTATLLDGTVFDATSLRNNTPVNFVIGKSNVLTGLQLGALLMHVGDKATLLLPSTLAYGAGGTTGQNGTVVPPNTVVRFDVEMVDLDFALADDATITQYLTSASITTAQKQTSGLYYVPVTANPTGTPATAGKTVSVLYTGRLMDGTVFDATSQRGNKPFDFLLGSGSVIKGWDEGIALMRKGEKAILLIPSALAYGSNSPSTTIPANSVLRFEVEVVDVK
jgi:FKBP-type peptidyl-prolyl cis-trans isomerase